MAEVRLPANTDGTVLEICQSIPGQLLAAGEYEAAREAVLAMVALAGTGVLPHGGKRKTKKPDAAGNLWFVQTAYVYYKLTGDQETWRSALLGLCKRITQGVIAGLFEGTAMGDGGLLSGRGSVPAIMELNVLWYSALSILAEELRAAGDTAGDHFERLGGRFRRSFLKAYWCEAHECLCDPARLQAEGHGAAGEIPEGAQLLTAVVPFSAVPRTKQRQIVDAVAKVARRELGIVVSAESAGVKRDPRGELVSPLFLAWLAEGHVRTSDTPATSLAEAITWMAGVQKVLEETGGLSRLYVGAAPAKVAGNAAPHGPTMAEVRRVLTSLEVASGRPIGNSKRTRITGSLMPTVAPPTGEPRV